MYPWEEDKPIPSVVFELYSTCADSYDYRCEMYTHGKHFFKIYLIHIISGIHSKLHFPLTVKRYLQNVRSVSRTHFRNNCLQPGIPIYFACYQYISNMYILGVCCICINLDRCFTMFLYVFIYVTYKPILTGEWFTY